MTVSALCKFMKQLKFIVVRYNLENILDPCFFFSLNFLFGGYYWTGGFVKSSLSVESNWEMATEMDHHYHHSYGGNEWSQTEVPSEGQQAQVHSKITLSIAVFCFLVVGELLIE